MKDTRLSPRPIALACALLMSGSALAAKIDLSDLSLEDLMNIEITSASKYSQTQAQAPSAITVVTRDEIRRYGWRNLADLLAAQRGFHVFYDHTYHYLGMRGFSPRGDYNSRIMFLIDGMRVNENVYDSSMPDGAFPLDLSLIERVEIVRGPGASMYGGNALFGVINIITRSPEDLSGGEAALAIGSDALREGRLTAGGKGERASWLVSVSGNRSDGGRFRFDDIAPGQLSPAGADAERWQRFFGRLDVADWRAMLIHSERRKHNPSANYGTDPNDARHWEQDGFTLLNLQRQIRLAGDQSLSVNLSAGRYAYRSLLPYAAAAYGYDALYSDEATGRWWGGDLRWTAPNIGRHTWVAGLEWVGERQEILAYERYTDGTSYDYPSISKRSDRVGVYVQDEIRLSDNLSGTIGLRLDKTTGRDLRLSPRLALVNRFSEQDTGKLLYGTAFRNPSASEQSSVPAGYALREERIRTLEAVWEHRFGSQSQFNASLYQYRMLDGIYRSFDSVSVLNQALNGQAIDATGAEIEYQWHDASGLALRASYGNQRLDQGGAWPANSPRQMAKLNLTLPLGSKDLLLALEGQAMSKRRTLTGGEVGGMALANATLSWRQRSWDMAFSIYNLFDRQVSDPAPDDPWVGYYYPGVARDRFVQNGRTWRFGATLRF